VAAGVWQGYLDKKVILHRLGEAIKHVDGDRPFLDMAPARPYSLRFRSVTDYRL
jgi:hypothetical protein